MSSRMTGLHLQDFWFNLLLLRIKYILCVLFYLSRINPLFQPNNSNDNNNNYYLYQGA